MTGAKNAVLRLKSTRKCVESGERVAREQPRKMIRQAFGYFMVCTLSIAALSGGPGYTGYADCREKLAPSRAQIGYHALKRATCRFV